MGRKSDRLILSRKKITAKVGGVIRINFDRSPSVG